MESFIHIDKNMAVQTNFDDTALVWHDVRQAPFCLHGFYEPIQEPFFRRVPASVADATSEGVSRLSQESAGGRVRFSTDSPYIAIRAKFRVVGRSSHLALISSAGFDLYADDECGSRYVKEFRMPLDMTDSYEQLVWLYKASMRSFTIHFPVHSVVECLEIGLHPDAVVAPPRPYRALLPILVYGSSIVHGTAASRPGLIYPNILARELNMDVKNYGFSGMAKGEAVLAEWLAKQPMSAFVCDYDHNAPTVEHLDQTHHAFYEIVRDKNPDVPYIMITRPNYWTQIKDPEDILRRRDVVMASYLKARQKGDKNVYFIDGTSFFNTSHMFDYTVDDIHPGDGGFVRMAEVIGGVLRHILM